MDEARPVMDEARPVMDEAEPVIDEAEPVIDGRELVTWARSLGMAWSWISGLVMDLSLRSWISVSGPFESYALPF